MKKLLGILIITSAALACQDVYPLTPPKDPPLQTDKCQAPPIERNIIGTWHFKSTFNPYYYQRDTITRGTITFTADNQIIDPDSLFANFNETGGALYAITKTYAPDQPSPAPEVYAGSVFWVYLTSKKGQEIDFFVVVSNECNQIHLRLWQSGNNGIGFYLTRI